MGFPSALNWSGFSEFVYFTSVSWSHKEVGGDHIVVDVEVGGDHIVVDVEVGRDHIDLLTLSARLKWAITTS